MTEITAHGARFAVTASHPGFWANLSSGQWEPELFQIIDRFVGPETTVLDVGAWIGPITLYAARRARRVFAFEPDPVAFARLRENLAVNPDLENVAALNVCVGVEDGVVRMGSRNQPGDSGSSILYGEADAGWSAEAVRLERFIREQGLTGPLFIKMDVEGYEYTLVPHLLRALEGCDYTLHLSTHPRLLNLEMRREGRAALAARAAVARAQVRLVRGLLALPWVADSRLRPLRAWNVALRILAGRGLTGDFTLVASTRPAP